MQAFELGELVMSRAVHNSTKESGAFSEYVWDNIRRFARQDWGDLDEEDTARNHKALSSEVPGQILAIYKHEEHPTIWIITEADRSLTTVLFPNEN